MRKRLGPTLEALGRKSGLDHKSISRLEHDNSRVQLWVLGLILPHLAAQFKNAFPETNGNPYDFIVPPATFGSWLKNQRLRRGLKLNELAQQLGVRPFTLIRYEADHSRPETAVRERLKRLLELTDLPVIDQETLSPEAWSRDVDLASRSESS
jgi:transcriptional regulator with XRE-family HTH domain